MNGFVLKCRIKYYFWVGLNDEMIGAKKLENLSGEIVDVICAASGTA